ncbi:MAG: GNAT family N-acetyltransferase [Simkania negevensis]|nr:GNAT family N-acetyltransferase [Simkania negevensis]
MTRIAEKTEFDIRYSTLEDEPYLKEWMSHKEMVHYFPVSSENEIAMMCRNWIGFSRFRASLTAVYKDKPVGIATLFLMPYRKLIHHSMIYFIVNPDHLQQGIGTSLMRNLNHLGKTAFHFETLHAEVYEGSKAVSLLQKCGYHILATQEHFVKEKGKYLSRILLEVELKQDGK